MTDTCNETFELFGDQWNLRIIDSIHLENRRFTELQRLTTINTATLTKKLKYLEKLGLLDRIQEYCDKQSVAYRLTELGRELLPIIKKMRHFSSQLDVSAKE